MIDWNIIVGPLASFIVGGLIGKEVFRILDKPRVTIQVRRVVYFAQEDGGFLSIKIANAGRTAATDCVGTISLFNVENEQIVNINECAIDENLHEYRDENYNFQNPRPQFVTRESHYELSNEPLCWADMSNPPKVTINPGTTHRLDICKYYSKGEDRYFIFPSDRGWRKVRARVSASSLNGRILICPGNDFPTPANFTLYVDSSDSPILEMNHPTFWEWIRTNLRRSSAFLD